MMTTPSVADSDVTTSELSVQDVLDPSHESRVRDERGLGERTSAGVRVERDLASAPRARARVGAITDVDDLAVPVVVPRGVLAFLASANCGVLCHA